MILLKQSENAFIYINPKPLSKSSFCINGFIESIFYEEIETGFVIVCEWFSKSIGG